MSMFRIGTGMLGQEDGGAEPTWRKSPSRLVMIEVFKIFSRIRQGLTEGNVDGVRPFAMREFMEVFGQAVMSLAEEGDYPIIWKTSKRQYEGNLTYVAIVVVSHIAVPREGPMEPETDAVVAAYKDKFLQAMFAPTQVKYHVPTLVFGTIIVACLQDVTTKERPPMVRSPMKNFGSEPFLTKVAEFPLTATHRVKDLFDSRKKADEYVKSMLTKLRVKAVYDHLTEHNQVSECVKKMEAPAQKTWELIWRTLKKDNFTDRLNKYRRAFRGDGAPEGPPSLIALDEDCITTDDVVLDRIIWRKGKHYWKKALLRVAQHGRMTSLFMETIIAHKRTFQRNRKRFIEAYEENDFRTEEIEEDTKMANYGFVLETVGIEHRPHVDLEKMKAG